jgi:CCR4-NOT transcription complex subunit 3
MGFLILSMTREKFKVCEKETKTKTYSKEGLARAAVLDPEEQAKEDMRSFLQGSIDKLGVQIESCEADMERLSSGKGVKKNKVELEEKESTIKRHRWHIGKMEQIIRMIDNDGEASKSYACAHFHACS